MPLVSQGKSNHHTYGIRQDCSAAPPLTAEAVSLIEKETSALPSHIREVLLEYRLE